MLKKSKEIVLRLSSLQFGWRKTTRTWAWLDGSCHQTQTFLWCLTLTPPLFIKLWLV